MHFGPLHLKGLMALLGSINTNKWNKLRGGLQVLRAYIVFHIK